MAQMQRISFGQPNVAVDSGPLVEPAIAEARVHADHQIVLFSISQEVANIEAKWRIAVVVAADEIAVQKHQSTAEGSIEFNNGSPRGIFLWNIECAPVPPD